MENLGTWVIRDETRDFLAGLTVKQTGISLPLLAEMLALDLDVEGVEFEGNATLVLAALKHVVGNTSPLGPVNNTPILCE